MFYKKLIINILYLSFFFSFFSSKINAQNVDYEKMSLYDIEESFANIHDNVTGEKVAKIFIKKAKKEKNIEALFRAYHLAAVHTKNPINLKYSDSIIIIAKKINKPEFLANGYIYKSAILVMESLYEEYINNLIIAYQYSKKTSDDYLKNKILYNISQNEIYLGNYLNAQKQLKKVNKYFTHNFDKEAVGTDYPMHYFYSLVSLIDINTKLGNQSENYTLYKNAFAKLKLNKSFKIYEAYFISCEGTDAYYNKNYPLAISKLNEAIKKYKDQYSHFTEIYYIGLSYWKLNQKEKAIEYFLKLDKEYYKNKNQDPQYRPAYELLFEYYKEKGNKKKQLEYINKLIILDHSYEKNFKYIFAKINKEYTSEKLIQEKNSIENSLKFHRLLIIFIIILSFSIISFIFYRYTKTQKLYKERFRKIIAERNSFSSQNKISINSNEKKKSVELLYSKIPGLSAATIDSILSRLEIFENEKQFLNNKITQKSLSEELMTNPSYLSKIINVYKEKNFNQYINDLRLEYIIKKIETDEQYRDMDIKEIANQAGFNSAESFSDNFQRKFQIKPSYFIKMMKEDSKISSQSHNPTSDSENA